MRRMLMSAFHPFETLAPQVCFRPIADFEPLSHRARMDGSDEVFLVYFEIGGGSARLREEGYAGGFVTAFVPSSDLRRAPDAGEAALVEDGYEVVNIDKALRYDPEEWEHDAEVTRAVAKCRRSGEISYSTFGVWGH